MGKMTPTAVWVRFILSCHSKRILILSLKICSKVKQKIKLVEQTNSYTMHQMWRGLFTKDMTGIFRHMFFAFQAGWRNNNNILYLIFS